MVLCRDDVVQVEKRPFLGDSSSSEVVTGAGTVAGTVSDSSSELS